MATVRDFTVYIISKLWGLHKMQQLGFFGFSLLWIHLLLGWVQIICVYCENKIICRKDTIFGAAENSFGPSYFMTALSIF
jgi:hypothetical protein